MYGFRYASTGTGSTLYASDVLDNGGRALASEPLCGVAGHWTEVPEDTVVRLSEVNVRAERQAA